MPIRLPPQSQTIAESKRLSSVVAAGGRIAWKCSIFLLIGLLIDYAVGASMCSFYGYTNKFPPLGIATTNGTVIGSTWFTDEDRDYELRFASSAYRDDYPPVIHRDDDVVLNRGPLYKAWRHLLLGLDSTLTGEPNKRDIGYIRFGWPLRSWEAWWVPVVPPPPGPAEMPPVQYLRQRPILYFGPGSTVLTYAGRLPRAFPVAFRLREASINAAIYGGTIALVWYSASAWRKNVVARKQGRCPTCGYSLAGLPTGICPECGRL